MPPEILKRATRSPVASDPEIAKVVSRILLDVEKEGERAVRRYSERFDNWSPPRFTVDPSSGERATESVPAELREHIEIAAEHIRTFARAQRETMSDLEIETLPGVVLGHRHIPVDAVGSYTPAGRYPLIASALMTTVVPKEAGVNTVIAAAPPHAGIGILPAMHYAMGAGGADAIVAIGGAHGLAALAFGIEDIEPVDMVIGAGNAYVAEAKRQLFGQVGIDLLAGPTEVLVIADETADPSLVAIDVVGQLEHGPTSVGWVVTTSRSLGEEVIRQIDARLERIATGEVAREAWESFGEVVVCESNEEAVLVSDRLAPEHVEVHTADLDWYLENLRNYGSLFLGVETSVAFGDKGIGTNHVLPTARAARYTGGLWVGKFLKTETYQRASAEGASQIAPTILALCEAELLPGHAQTVSARQEGVGAQS